MMMTDTELGDKTANKHLYILLLATTYSPTSFLPFYTFSPVEVFNELRNINTTELL